VAEGAEPVGLVFRAEQDERLAAEVEQDFGRALLVAGRRGRAVNPWDSQYLDVRDYQWREVAVPFWKDINARARDADVQVCIEMHPHNIVYNPGTMERLATEISATHVGAEMDPSHLFWAGHRPGGGDQAPG
jgi:sugar phosphate isomerase/epimerase